MPGKNLITDIKMTARVFNTKQTDISHFAIEVQSMNSNFIQSPLAPFQ